MLSKCELLKFSVFVSYTATELSAHFSFSIVVSSQNFALMLIFFIHTSQIRGIPPKKKRTRKNDSWSNGIIVNLSYKVRHKSKLQMRSAR